MQKTTSEKKHKLIFTNLKSFIKEIVILIGSPVFALLTIMGNALIGLFSLAFYYFEHEKNLKIYSYIDALWWGVATATTTGYGDITPVTIQGKILGIILMITGMAFFAMFTALFAKTILNSSTYYRH
jgi:voltage-gated potassium channel